MVRTAPSQFTPPSLPQKASYVVVIVGVLCTAVFHASVWNIKDEKRANKSATFEGALPVSTSKRAVLWGEIKTASKSPNFYIRIVGALRSFAAKSRVPPFLRIVIAPSFQLQSKNDLQVFGRSRRDLQKT
eukprot:sb/3475181/